MVRPHYVESLLVVNNNIEGQILAGDKTILDVFGEKSKDFDDMIPSGKNIFGQETAPLSQMDLLEMIMPFAGSIRGGRAAKGTIQQMLDIAKMKNIRLGHPNKWELSKKGVPNKKDLDYWKRTEQVEDIDDFIKMDDAKDALKNIMKQFGIENPDKIFRGFSQN